MHKPANGCGACARARQVLPDLWRRKLEAFERKRLDAKQRKESERGRR